METPDLPGGHHPGHLSVAGSLSLLHTGLRGSTTQSAATEQLPRASPAPSPLDNVHGASREPGDGGRGLRKHGAPHQFAVTCHQNRAVQTVESRLLFGALRWVSAEGPVATGACGTGASQGDPGPQRSAGPFALGCLPDRQHGLPGFLSLAWFLLDDSEYAHSTSLLRLISRGRQKVILHGQK